MACFTCSSDDVKMVKQTVKDPDKQGKGRGPKGRGRGREVITSSSVFSMGPADKKIGFGGVLCVCVCVCVCVGGCAYVGKDQQADHS